MAYEHEMPVADTKDRVIKEQKEQISKLERENKDLKAQIEFLEGMKKSVLDTKRRINDFCEKLEEIKRYNAALHADNLRLLSELQREQDARTNAVAAQKALEQALLREIQNHRMSHSLKPVWESNHEE